MPDSGIPLALSYVGTATLSSFTRTHTQKDGVFLAVEAEQSGCL